MTKNHLKARAAPRTWNIPRKENTFTTRPNPGSQSFEMTLPLSLVLRAADVGSTTKEMNFILRSTQVLVNNTRRWDLRFGVGFMDVISLPDLKKHFQLVLDSQGKLAVVSIDEKHSTSKLSQVRSTSTVKGGKAKASKLQLHLSDGRNVFVDKPLAAGSTVTIDLTKKIISAVHAVEPKAHVVLTAGKHRGTQGTIEAINGEFVTVKTKEGSISTKKDYAFVLGGKA